MIRFTGCAVAAALALGALAAPSAGEAKEKKDRLTLRAQRAGWILGMYVGEERAQPHPFVLQVDPASDAKAKGVRPGDELIRFDDLETDPLWRVFERANELRPGKEVHAWFRRGVQTIRVTLRVPKDPGAAASEKSDEKAKEAKEKGEKGAESGEQTAEDKKKKKKKPPVVIKPIPAPDN